MNSNELMHKKKRKCPNGRRKTCPKRSRRKGLCPCKKK